MKLFLKARHWQLFLIMIGIPFLFNIIYIASLMATDKPSLVWIMMYVPIITILFAGVFLGWFWAIGNDLQDKIPGEVRMSRTKFKLFILSPAIYLFLFIIFMALLVSGNFEPDPMYGFIIVPLHLYCMFCMFYCLYFVSRTIKMAELQRKVKFDDHIGEFFMIWFFPIGIWFIQPRVNKLAEL